MENQSSNKDSTTASVDLPRASVKRIMKINQEVGYISSDSLAATCKATELFVAELARTCYAIASANGRKTIRIDDITTAALSSKYEFLDGAFNTNTNVRSNNNNSSTSSNS